MLPPLFLTFSMLLYVLFQLFASGRMTKLLERLDLDLTDPFTGQVEVLSNLLQGMLTVHPDPESHADDLLFSFRQ